MGTSSIKDQRTLEKIDKIVKTGKVSHVFLTHPDEDHYNYFFNMDKSKIEHLHLGGKAELWGKGQTSRTMAEKWVELITGNTNQNSNRGLDNYEVTHFQMSHTSPRKSIPYPLCNGKLNMEILFGGLERYFSKLSAM